ncbi:Glutamate receptor 2 [Halocaridina rubra]|uniref:Glutamate receptor 2 n=1 Tax=Halocaridina rubra TaxID=373956 RepID=A0AAN8WPC4_HALRR
MSPPGLLRLQEIFQSIRPTRADFKIRLVQRVETAKDALGYLKSLERINRWSKKYVVLDCGTEMAKKLIIGHVRDVQMGRRNYHYLLSGLVSTWRGEGGSAKKCLEVTYSGALIVRGECKGGSAMEC